MLPASIVISTKAVGRVEKSRSQNSEGIPIYS